MMKFNGETIMIDVITLSQNCAPNVHPTTLSAIVKYESNQNPYAIHINGATQLTHSPKNLAQALSLATRLKQRGINFDAGLGQVNVSNIKGLKLSIHELFDPCKNIAASSEILTKCYEQAASHYGFGQKALHAALSCYNTGNFTKGFHNGYVNNVLAAAKTIVPAIIPLNQIEPSNDQTHQKKLTSDKKDAFDAKPKRDVFSHSNG
jgi:type IV secretion system protein VirB1